eukprot:5672017-Alexandrium_andersonii.AAC.1
MPSTSATSPGPPFTKRIPPRQATARTSYFRAYPAIAATNRHMSPFCIGAMAESPQSSSSAQAK